MPEPGSAGILQGLDKKELQSLCLDIKVLNEDMKEIEIKDSDDDINDTARELEWT